MAPKVLFALIIASVLLVPAASAQERPQAVFELDAAGGATMAISESAELDADEGRLQASADESNTVAFTGTLTDDLSISSPDYNLKLTLQGGTSQMAFDMRGTDVSSLISAFGAFDMDVAMRVAGGKLEVDASGTMDKRMLSEVFMIDPELIQADLDGFKADLQDAMNELFALMPVETTPAAAITEFGLTGGETLGFTLKMELEGWNAFFAASTAAGYQDDPPSADFVRCLGIDTADVVSSLLSAQSETAMTLTASGDRISGSVASSGQASGQDVIKSMALDIGKSGAKTDIRGSLVVSDAKVLLTCMAQGYLPGDYVMGSIDFMLVKSRGAESASQSIESELAGLAVKSGENYVVSFPAEMTRDFDVTVKIPSGLSILSVEGGTSSGSTAVSEEGKEFKVTYGKGGFKLDMTMIIIIAVILAVAALLLIRRRNLSRGDRAPAAPRVPHHRP